MSQASTDPGAADPGTAAAWLWALVYLALATFCLALGLRLGGLFLLLLWPAATYLALAWAFLRRQPELLGKRADGRLRPLSRLLLAPYLLFLRLVLQAKRRLLRGEDACNRVAPGVYLGRWPGPGEVPPDVDLIVDLTAELPAPRAAAAGRRYRCLPTLNRLAPRDEDFRRLVLELAPEPGPLYIHCGAGKGRSATVAAALLIARGLAADVAEAEALLRAARPVVHLHPAQRELVRRFARGLER